MTAAALGPYAKAGTATESRALLEVAFVAGLGFLLFGDYLSLSLARALTGQSAGWTACAAAAQVGTLGVAVLLGRLRGLVAIGEVLWFGALSAVMVAHVVLGEVAGRGLNDYGVDKVLAWFGLCAPALLCGIAAGRTIRPPGGVWLAVFLVPLLLGCGLSLLTDPERITILYHRRLDVHFGVLVQPAHQGLALSLAKIALGCYAWSLVQDRGSRLRRATLAVLIVTLGLIVMSGARGYTLGVLGALAMLWVLGRGPILVAGTALLAGLWIFEAVSSELVFDRFDPTRALESLAYEERVHAWGTAWEAFLAAPLLGHGPGGFAEFDNWGHRSYAHNVFLEFASEFGVLGLLCFTGMLASIALRVWRCRRARLDGGRAFAIGFFLFAVVGALSVGDLIRNYFLFFAMGLVIAVTRVPDRDVSAA